MRFQPLRLLHNREHQHVLGLMLPIPTQTGQSSYVWTYTGVLGTDYSITSGGGNSNLVTLKWLTVGSKTVTVNYTDGNGCTATSPISSTATTVNPLPNDISNGFAGNTICAGDNGTLTFDALDASFVAPYTVVYSDGTNSWSQVIPNASAFTFNVTVNPATTTNYSLVSITNGNGCIITTTDIQDATAQITVRPLPTATISGTTAVCLNATSPNITFTGAGGTAPYTFTYNINGGSNLTVATSSGNSVTVAVPTSATGSFVYTLVSVQDGSSTTCSQLQSGSASITVNPLPIIYTLTGSSICTLAPNTGTVTLNNSETGVSYQLKDGSNNNVQSAKAGITGSALTWTGLAAGNGYYVVATGASPTNCSNQTSAVNVTSVTNPTVYTLTGSSICTSSPNTGTITLSNSETGVSYQLKDSGNNDVQAAKSGTTGTALTWTGLAGGNGYYVVATGASPTNCPSQTATANVIVSLVPAASVTQSTPYNICQNGTAYVTGATASNGTILWTHNGSGTISGGTTLTPSYTAVPADGGKMVTLTMTVSNSPCPQATANFTINVSSTDDVPITIGPAMAPICIGETSASLGASIGSGALTVLWTDGGIGGTFSPSASDVNATWKPPVLYSGTATLILTVTNSCGSNFSSKSISVESFPTINMGPTMAAICQGSTTPALGGSVGGSATGGIWTSSVGGTFNPSATDVANATWTPPAAYHGTAILTLTTSGSACDPISDTKSVIVDEMPVITQPVNQLDCEGAFVNFQAVATIGTYVWQRKKPTDADFITIPAEPNVTYPTPGTIRLENVGNSDAPSGTQYRVIITNGSCSVISNAATLTVNEITGVIPSVANPTVTDVIICNGTNFNYQVTTSIPANVVSYQWKKWNNPGQWDNVVNGGAISGATTNQLTFTGATPSESGKYQVTVTFNSSGADCNVSSDSRTRVLTVLPPLVAPVISPAQTICSGATPAQLTATAASGGSVTPSFTYQWQGSPDNSTWTNVGTNALTFQPPVLMSSTYYRIVATDNGAYACGSVTSASVLITVNPIPNVNDPSDQSVCNGALTSAVNFTGAVAGTVYNWTNDTPSIGLAASGSGDIAAFTAVNSGSTIVKATITVTPIYTNGGTSCSGASQTFTITVNPTPTVIATPASKTICSNTGPNIVLTGSVAGTTFSWTVTETNVTGASDGNGSIINQILTATGITAGTAKYTITPMANGCSGTPIDVTITVNPMPIVTNTPANATYCNGTSVSAYPLTGTPAGVVFDITGGLSVGLTDRTGVSSIPSFITNTATNTTVTAIITITPRANGCVGVPATYTITVNPIPNVSVSPIKQTICSGGTTNVLLGVSVANALISWTTDVTPAGSVTGVSDATDVTLSKLEQTLVNTTTGTATVVYTISAKNGVCSGASTIVTITVLPRIDLIITNPATVCSPSTVDLTAAAVTAGSTAGLVYSYWTDAAATVALANPAAVGNGTYYIKGTRTTTNPNNTCSEIKPVTVTVAPTPTLVINQPAPVCAPGTVDLSTTIGAGTTPGLTYSYWLDAGATTTYTTPATAGDGDYYIKGTSADGCFDIKPVTVKTYADVPTVTFIDGFASIICQGSAPRTYTATAANAFTLTYSLDAASLAAGNTVNSVTGQVTFASGFHGTIKLRVDATGCVASNSAIHTITVNELPTVTLTPSTTTICQGQSVVLTANSSGGSTMQTLSGSSGTINLSIPNNSNASYTYPVINLSEPSSANLTTADVVIVTVNITHTRDSDLDIFLVDPSGTRAMLLSHDNGGNGDNYSGTVFRTDESNSITGGSAPFTGNYLPQGSISTAPDRSGAAGGGSYNLVIPANALNGAPINGNWSLRVFDDQGGNQQSNNLGTLVNWSLSIIRYVGSGFTTVFNGSADIGAVSYSGTLNSIATVTVTPNSAGTHIYTATTTDANGCVATSNQITVIVNETPKAKILANYCAGNGKIGLTAVGGLAGATYVWSTGATSNYIEVDEVKIYSVTITNQPSGCAATATLDVSHELVVNGNFDAGNTGFTSGYGFRPSWTYPAVATGAANSSLWDENYYGIGTNARYYHTNFWGNRDHTPSPDGGNYMIVNGNTNAGTAIWQEVVTVLPNTNYYFSAWAMSLNADGHDAVLQFEVNGVLVGSTATLTAGVTNDNNNGWIRFYSNPKWNSGSVSGPITIRIRNVEPAAGGNDFGLDDISFGTLDPLPVTIDVTAADVCEGGTIQLYSNIQDGAGTHHIQLDWPQWFCFA